MNRLILNSLFLSFITLISSKPVRFSAQFPEALIRQKKTWHPKINRPYLVDDETVKLKEEDGVKSINGKYYTSFIQIMSPSQTNLRKSQTGKKMDCSCRFVKDIQVKEPKSGEVPFTQPQFNSVTQGMMPIYTQPAAANALFPTTPVAPNPIITPPVAPNANSNLEMMLLQTKTVLNNIENILRSNTNQQAMFQPQYQQQFIQQQYAAYPNGVYNYQANPIGNINQAYGYNGMQVAF